MLGSVHSPDSSDDHLRRLLDQRTARADPHGLYSALSEFSDTPSIYSRAFFSPRPSDGSHPDLLQNGFPYRSPTLSPHRRLLDDPTTSMLDLDEDVRSSMTISEAPDRDDKDNNRTLDVGEGEEDQDTHPRASYLGPKMRFHSRAPWEMEDEPLPGEGEPETTQGHFASILTGGRYKASLKSSSPSPRPSNVGRPSGESSRSQIISKRSFETTSSHISHPRGALYALAQESLSTSSLGRPPRSGRQDRLRGKFSLGRLRSHSPTPPSPNPSVTRLPLNNPTPNAPPSPRASCDTTSSALDVQALPGLSPRFAERRSLSHPDERVHPYANPDLVTSYATVQPPKSLLRSAQYPGVPQNDSIITVIENAFPTKSTLAPETPAAPAKKQISHVQGRDISSPVGTHSSLLHTDSPGQQSGTLQEPLSPLPIGANNIPGWADRSINPGFSLISLEEARAQRSRTVTTQFPPSLDSASSGEASIMATFRNTTHENSTTLSSALSDSNSSDRSNLRSRARSISASAKAKNPFQSFVGQSKPERRDSEPTLTQLPGKDVVATGGKTLKHKKSGFMRLFGNNGKLSEKDEDAVPVLPPLPPVPVIPDAHAVPKSNKLSPHRIPVPSLSPSLLEAVALQGGGDSSSEPLQATGKSPTSPKRTPPLALSINTGSSPISPTTPSTDPSSKGSLPQSAPPHIPEFPALKLRPISTLFSAQFGDHIVVSEFNDNEGDTKEKYSGQERPQRQNSLASSSGPSSASAASFAESQLGLSPIASSYGSAATTLTTPTTGGLMSPVTPSSWSYGTRFSVEQQASSANANANATPTTSHTAGTKDSEAAGIIKSLQEQLDNSRKVWQRRVWDLESQVRDLKGEIAELKPRCSSDYGGQRCEVCGRGGQSGAGVKGGSDGQHRSGGVMNRSRARTGGLSRFVNTQL